MNQKIQNAFLLGVFIFLGVFATGTGDAILDIVRAYDSSTNSFLTDLSQQDQVDGGGSADVVSQSASVAYGDTLYTTVVREVAGGTITHVFLLRNTGTQFEGWDHDSKTWTTNYGNMDPIDSDISLGFTAANPAMTVDSKGIVYVAYTRTIAAGADRKVFLSKYDPTLGDVYIWDDGDTKFTNNLAAPIASRDSVSNNSSASTTDADNVRPAIAVDSNDDVYIAYSNEMSNGADAKIFLSKLDSSAEDVFIWDDGASQMTNNLRAPTLELDSISRNIANHETSTSPAIAIDSNNNVYIAYLQEGIAAANNRIWLSKYDPALDDASVWDDGIGAFTNNLRAPDDELDSVGINQSNNTDASGSPAIGIDSKNNVYIAYVQQSENGTDPKVWLSKYDATLNDVYVWDANSTGSEGGAFTNNQRAPDDELDSVGVNSVAATDVLGNPALLIDRNDNVWISYVQETSAGANPHVFISKYDAALDDVYLWDDATSSFTNNQSSLGTQSGVSWNASADNDASSTSTPSMALADNGDIYIAYANELAGANNAHVNLTYIDVSEEDVYVWHDGIGAFTNNLQAPTTFTDTLDNSSADGDTSTFPELTATSSGIYISYLHRPDGTNDHLFFGRVGSASTNTTTSIPTNSSSGSSKASSSEILLLFMALFFWIDRRNRKMLQK